MVGQGLNREMLIKLLRKWMIDVYANTTSRAEIEGYLTSTLGCKVLSGQKRLIVLLGDTVLKIAYDRDGLMDNMNELICSNRLRELRQMNLITQDQLELFGICQMVNDSPFIIEMQAGVNFNEDPEFVEWYKRMMGVNTKPDYRSDALWFPVYMAENQQLRMDFQAQQQILSAYFAASDTTPTKEPRNETLVTRYDASGKRSKRLFLIDMGSCFPILQGANGSDIRPKCPRCGSNLIYIPFILPTSVAPSDAQEISGKYGCTNRSCNFYYENMSAGAPPVMLEDSKVFTIYQSENMSSVRYLRAIECFYYMPMRRVNNKQDLANAFGQEFGLSSIDPNLLNKMWFNYVAKACGDIMMRNPELGNVKLEDAPNMMKDYQIYRYQAVDALQRVGEAIDSIAMRAVGIIYAYAIINASNNTPDAIFDLMMLDQYSFINECMSLGISQQSAGILYNDIMTDF